MHALLNQGLWADREREIATVDRHGWQDAELRWKQRRQRRRAVARVLRALAAWLVPVDAASVAARDRLAAEPRA
jgi:hypothetical protein